MAREHAQQFELAFIGHSVSESGARNFGHSARGGGSLGMCAILEPLFHNSSKQRS
jgi:hypothetical protein